MKIKAFGMDIQVTEESVFVNGKEVFNKLYHCNTFMQGMHNYSSGSSLIKPKEEDKAYYKEFADNHRPILINKLFSEETEESVKEIEQRMNVIGQNGNDGLHYGFWEDMNNDLMDNNRNEGIWDTDN
jgi:hypothetical protein